MARLVVAVNEVFGTDAPAGAHEDGVIPLRAISQAFSCKIASPVFAFLDQKFRDGGGVLDDAISGGFVRLPFLPLSFLLVVVPRRGVGFGHGFLGGDLMKLGRRIMLRELFMTILKILSKDPRQSLTIERPLNFWHSTNQH